jgi:hypothetical protein
MALEINFRKMLRGALTGFQVSLILSSQGYDVYSPLN